MGQRYDFQERLVWSDGFLDNGIAKILQSRIPGCCEVRKAEQANDRQGTDYWAIREGEGLPDLSIDVKVRSRDYAPEGSDDLALETWSVIGSKVGWSRNAEKRTDFVLWFWQDTGRFFLVSFPALCKVFSRYWEAWRASYKTCSQDSVGWQSECVFVPRAIVVEALNNWSCGIAPRKETHA